MAITLVSRLHLPEDRGLHARFCAAQATGQRVSCTLRLPWRAQEAEVEAYVVEVTEGPDVAVTFVVSEQRT